MSSPLSHQSRKRLQKCVNKNICATTISFASKSQTCVKTCDFVTPLVTSYGGSAASNMVPIITIKPINTTPWRIISQIWDPRRAFLLTLSKSNSPSAGQSFVSKTQMISYFGGSIEVNTLDLVFTSALTRSTNRIHQQDPPTGSSNRIPGKLHQQASTEGIWESNIASQEKAQIVLFWSSTQSVVLIIIILVL